MLVPHDFSASAQRALEVAVELAGEARSEILLLHVSPLPPNLPPDTEVSLAGGSGSRADDLVTRGARRDLAAIAMPLVARGLQVSTHAVCVGAGDVSEAILDAAREVGADAIVVGTHGRRGLAHLLLGSVAEKLVRTAHVPVVTVRTRSPEAAPTREESILEDEQAG